MVSTRSRDVGDAALHADEVSSVDQAQPRARSARPAAASRPLEAVPEAATAAAHPDAAALAADPTLLDRLAEEMFAALDGAFGAAQAGNSGEGDSSGSESGEEEEEEEEESGDEEGAVPRNLRWKPELTLPSQPDLRREQAVADPASTYGGALAKQVRLAAAAGPVPLCGRRAPTALQASPHTQRWPPAPPHSPPAAARAAQGADRGGGAHRAPRRARHRRPRLV